MTRGHKYNLLKQSVREDACKFSLANRICTTLNILSAKMVDSVDVNIFVTSLKLLIWVNIVSLSSLDMCKH